MDLESLALSLEFGGLGTRLGLGLNDMALKGFAIAVIVMPS